MTQYAQHAGISPRAASDQLQRAGIDYMQPFDHAEADRRRQAMRHAARIPFSKMIYQEPAAPPAGEDPDETAPKDPAFAELQRRREYFRAECAKLDFEERVSKLIERAAVEKVAFRIGRQVRDAVLNVPSRLAGILAAETNQSTVHDLLESELRQCLEAMATDPNPGDLALAGGLQTSAVDDLGF